MDKITYDIVVHFDKDRKSFDFYRIQSNGDKIYINTIEEDFLRKPNGNLDFKKISSKLGENLVSLFHDIDQIFKY